MYSILCKQTFGTRSAVPDLHFTAQKREEVVMVRQKIARLEAPQGQSLSTSSHLPYSSQVQVEGTELAEVKAEDDDLANEEAFREALASLTSQGAGRNSSVQASCKG